jgi:hypothetical protein
MMNNQDCQKQTQKRPYRKPGMVQVPLRPEEAVLGNCKNGPSAGYGNAHCTTLNCKTIGS